MHGVLPPLPRYAFMAWCPIKPQGQLYILPLRYTGVDLGLATKEITKTEDILEQTSEEIIWIKRKGRSWGWGKLG
jgi:hypothetical protein